MTRKDLDPGELGLQVYPWLNSVVVPRPIAWVSSRSATGIDNLAPHSFFTVAGIDPPVLSFTSVGEKDTLRNVRATREFVVCLASEQLVEQVNLSGTDFPADTSEFDAVGVTREPSLRVTSPRVAESPVALECRYVDERAFGYCTVIFGQVVHLAVDEAVLRDGRPEITLLRPMARLGANQWTTIGEVSDRRRIPWSELSA
ncbi:MAG: flavin reductase family protein [Mycobacteriales bacterium]